MLNNRETPDGDSVYHPPPLSLLLPAPGIGERPRQGRPGQARVSSLPSPPRASAHPPCPPSAIPLTLLAFVKFIHYFAPLPLATRAPRLPPSPVPFDAVAHASATCPTLPSHAFHPPFDVDTAASHRRFCTAASASSPKPENRACRTPRRSHEPCSYHGGGPGRAPQSLRSPQPAAPLSVASFPPLPCLLPLSTGACCWHHPARLGHPRPLAASLPLSTGTSHCRQPCHFEPGSCNMQQTVATWRCAEQLRHLCGRRWRAFGQVARNISDAHFAVQFVSAALYKPPESQLLAVSAFASLCVCARRPGSCAPDLCTA